MNSEEAIIPTTHVNMTSEDAGTASAKPLNTVCPVCGMPVSSDIPPVVLTPIYAYHLEQERQPGAVAFCSLRCIELASADHDRYLDAARRNVINDRAS